MRHTYKTNKGNYKCKLCFKSTYLSYIVIWNQSSFLHQV